MAAVCTDGGDSAKAIGSGGDKNVGEADRVMRIMFRAADTDGSGELSRAVSIVPRDDNMLTKIVAISSSVSAKPLVNGKLVYPSVNMCSHAIIHTFRIMQYHCAGAPDT